MWSSIFNKVLSIWMTLTRWQLYSITMLCEGNGFQSGTHEVRCCFNTLLSSSESKESINWSTKRHKNVIEMRTFRKGPNPFLTGTVFLVYSFDYHYWKHHYGCRTRKTFFFSKFSRNSEAFASVSWKVWKKVSSALLVDSEQMTECTSAQ